MNDQQTSPTPIPTEWELWRRMVPKIRRCIKVGSKKPGRTWAAAATVGEIAVATGLSCEEVLRMIGMCGYLIMVNAGPGPIAELTVYEDGE